MKSFLVVTRIGFAIDLLVGRPTFRELASAELLGNATGFAGAIITSPYMSKYAATHTAGGALNHTGGEYGRSIFRIYNNLERGKNEKTFGSRIVSVLGNIVHVPQRFGSSKYGRHSRHC